MRLESEANRIVHNAESTELQYLTFIRDRMLELLNTNPTVERQVMYEKACEDWQREFDRMFLGDVNE